MKFNLSRSHTAWFLLFILSLGVGCGSGEAPPLEVPPLQPVTGTVTLDGNPEAGIAVTLVPEAGAQGNGASGITDAEGKFELKYRTGDVGAPVGDYIAFFSKMALPDGSPIPEGQTAADVMAEELIPAQYRDMDNRANRVSVVEGGKKLEFKLTSK